MKCFLTYFFNTIISIKRSNIIGEKMILLFCSWEQHRCKGDRLKRILVLLPLLSLLYNSFIIDKCEYI